MENKDEDVKITIFLKDKPRLLANATIAIKTDLFGWLTIKGFCIWKSDQMNERLQEYINITPPSNNVFGKYRPQVFIEDHRKWEEIEGRIYDAYHIKSVSQPEEKVDMKDIPF